MVMLPSSEDPRRPVYARSGAELPQPHAVELEMHKQSEKLIRNRTVTLVDNMLDKGKRDLVIRSVSSHMYNCVGMVFANRRTWLNVERLTWILQQDGYRRTTVGELHAGDIVVYTDDETPVHVGLIICVHPPLGNILNIRVLSKWGKDGEVEHRMQDVPSPLGKPSQFWTERSPHDIKQLFRGN